MTIETKDFAFEIKAVNEDGFFSGYGSVFGVTDRHDDIVQKGAFADTLSEWAAKGKFPSLLWQHRTSEPIGVYTKMVEDSVGLYVEGQLALKTMRGAEAYELMKMGAISGLSIGYDVRDDSWDRVTWIRTLKKLDLYEVSLVTFPANDSAQVTSVKQQNNQIQALKNLIKAFRN